MKNKSIQNFEEFKSYCDQRYKELSKVNPLTPTFETLFKNFGFIKAPKTYDPKYKKIFDILVDATLRDNKLIYSINSWHFAIIEGQPELVQAYLELIGQLSLIPEYKQQIDKEGLHRFFTSGTMENGNRSESINLVTNSIGKLYSNNFSYDDILDLCLVADDLHRTEEIIEHSGKYGRIINALHKGITEKSTNREPHIDVIHLVYFSNDDDILKLVAKNIKTLSSVLEPEVIHTLSQSTDLAAVTDAIEEANSIASLQQEGDLRAINLADEIANPPSESVSDGKGTRAIPVKVLRA